MACYKVGDPTRPPLYNWSRPDKQYGSKESCEEECEGAATGACVDIIGSGCVEVRPCQCYRRFLGIGSKCNPLP